MKWRLNSRRFLVVALTLSAALALSGTVAAQAKPGSSRRQGIFLTAPRAGQDNGMSQPCFWQFPDCASSDPRVTFGFGSIGDTSACEFSVTFQWGDKSDSVTQKFPGSSQNGDPLIYFDHVYKTAGTYNVAGTLSVTQGSCTSGTGPFSWDFTLAHVSGTLSLAALGDSYSSGEGAGDYKAGTDSAHGCHRSQHAWALQLQKYVANHDVTLTSNEYFIACSGAVSKSLKSSFKGQQPQVTALQHLLPQPALVTMTIGGNDLGFSDVLEDCYKHDCVSDGTVSAVEAKLPKEETKLADDYADLLTADPGATVLIVGYPRIFDESDRCEGLPVISKWGFTVAEEKALNKLTDMVDTTISAAATKVGVSYVPVTEAFSGHEMCTKNSWVYDVGFEQGFGDDQQQGHPTAKGQEAIAKIVATYINKHL